MNVFVVVTTRNYEMEISGIYKCRSMAITQASAYGHSGTPAEVQEFKLGGSSGTTIYTCGLNGYGDFIETKR